MSSTVIRTLTASRFIASRTPLVASRSPIRAFAPLLTSSQRAFTATTNANAKMPELKSFDHPIATLDSSMAHRLPEQCPTLFEAKKAKKLSFEEIAKVLGRDEVAVAALFYGQAKASEEDVAKLSELLGIEHGLLHSQLYGVPDRGRSMEMPPKEPLIYRLYEIVQNYGYAYKAILNEKFGDGIMSAISFSTNVKKETDQAGDWVVITMRGKWLPYKRF